MAGNPSEEEFFVLLERVFLLLGDFFLSILPSRTMKKWIGQDDHADYCLLQRDCIEEY